jgi:hypothetical protein
MFSILVAGRYSAVSFSFYDVRRRKVSCLVRLAILVCSVIGMVRRNFFTWVVNSHAESRTGERLSRGRSSHSSHRGTIDGVTGT